MKPWTLADALESVRSDLATYPTFSVLETDRRDLEALLDGISEEQTRRIELDLRNIALVSELEAADDVVGGNDDIPLAGRIRARMEYAEELKADALRYRYLRDHRAVGIDTMLHGNGCPIHTAEELDAKIDALSKNTVEPKVVLSVSEQEVMRHALMRSVTVVNPAPDAAACPTAINSGSGVATTSPLGVFNSEAQAAGKAIAAERDVKTQIGFPISASPDGYGKCEVCGKPVYPPTNRYMAGAYVFNNKAWHGDCFPRSGISGTTQCL